jgi:hypothetical protein
MAEYRCYILDADDHILQAYELDCPDDLRAESAAEDILERDPYYQSVELWASARRIRKFERTTLAGLRMARRLDKGRKALNVAQ